MSPKIARGGFGSFRPCCVLATLFCAMVLLAPPASAAADKVRVAVLKFGTVSWGLDVIKRHRLDIAEGIDLEVKEFASTQATMVALQAGDVDIAVSDWIWVARQRQDGKPFTFVPYSTATGALMAPAGAEIGSLVDLNGKRVGVAGGALDKSWLLLRALSLKTQGSDLLGEVEPVFGAPPLLNEQIRQGRIDAVLNYWHYAARLEAFGFRKVISVQDVQRRLGVASEVPMIGYVFDERWANEHREAVLGFVRAVGNAKSLLSRSDAEWEAVRPLMMVSDEATFAALRGGYRAGIPRHWGDAERADIERLFDILRSIGGTQLVGEATGLPAGTFWAEVSY